MKVKNILNSNLIKKLTIANKIIKSKNKFYLKMSLRLFFLISIFSITLSHSSEIKKVACKENHSELECSIFIEGIIKDDEVLYIRELGDIDVASFEGIELGRTGYFFGKEFYAQFIPRFYSLKPISGKTSPIISLQCKSITGLEIGPSKKLENIKIINESEQLKKTILDLGPRLFIFLFLVVLASYFISQGKSNYQDGWEWNQSTLKVFFFSTIIFEFSMNQIIRISVPLIISVRCENIIHALSLSITLFCLTDLLRTSNFEDKTSVSLVTNKKDKINTFLIAFNLILFLVSIALILLSIKNQFKKFHSMSIIVQCFSVLLTLIFRIKETHLSVIWKRSLTGSKLFFLSLVTSSVSIIYDSFSYYFFHMTGNIYFIEHFLKISLIMASYRLFELRSCEKKGLQFFEKCRSQLKKGKDGQGKLNVLCQLILKQWKSDQVSIFSIHNNKEFLLISVGSKNNKIDHRTKKLRKILEILIKKRNTLFISERNELTENDFDIENNTSCFVIPVLQNNEIIAAITITHSKNKKFKPIHAQILEICTSMLELEVLSALLHTETENQLKQIKKIALSTSGIVIEQMNSLGHIQSLSDNSRRIIISVDQVKSTYIDQISNGSEIIWKLYLNYKKEVYAHWMAIKDIFELVSKDVRGDDFWVLTPKKFKNHYLAQLGPEKVALIASHLFEKYCREISFRPEYLILKRIGTHVAVCADDITVISLGTSRSICIDIHAKNMSKIHRIRSEANPGIVLVDATDKKLKTALEDKNVFITSDFEIDLNSKSFPDLQSLPKIIALTNIVMNQELIFLSHQVQKLARNSPYRK